MFLAAPPTPANLAAFEAWSSGAGQRSEPLARRLSGCLRLALGPGDTLLLPGGWPHAVSTPQDSLVYGERACTRVATAAGAAVGKGRLGAASPARWAGRWLAAEP